MKGLIIKDLQVLKIQAKAILIIAAIFLFYSVFTKNSLFFGGFLTVYSAMLPVTILSYDERAGWDKYALSMPLTRQDMVLSKYLLGVFLPSFAVILNLFFNVVLQTGPLQEIFSISLFEFAIAILFLSFLLPIVFKVGVEKGRILMTVLFFVPIAGLTLLSRSEMNFPFVVSFNLLQAITPILVLVILFASFLISRNIYQGKEF